MVVPRVCVWTGQGSSGPIATVQMGGVGGRPWRPAEQQAAERQAPRRPGLALWSVVRVQGRNGNPLSGSHQQSQQVALFLTLFKRYTQKHRGQKSQTFLINFPLNWQIKSMISTNPEEGTSYALNTVAYVGLQASAAPPWQDAVSWCDSCLVTGVGHGFPCGRFILRGIIRICL